MTMHPDAWYLAGAGIDTKCDSDAHVMELCLAKRQVGGDLPRSGLPYQEME